MRTIRLGLSATFTGRYDTLGEQSFKGIVLWAEYVNSSGGIYVEEYDDYLPVEIVYEDDCSEPENTKRITEKLITDKSTDIILGPYSSSLTLAVAEVCSRHNVTLWNYGGSSDKITSSGYRNIISTITPASEYFTETFELLRKKLGEDLGIAIAYAGNSGFATTVAKGLIDYASQSGCEIYEYRFRSGEGSFEKLISEMTGNAHDAVFFVGRFDDDLNFARQIAEEMHRFRAVTLVGASIEQFREELGEKFTNGFISTSQWDPGLRFKPDEGPDSSEFRNMYVDRFDSEPDYLSAQSYNIGIIIKKCIEMSGNLDDIKLRETAKRLSFSTFYGDFSVDPLTGCQKAHKMLVIQWQKGTKRIVSPEKYATSEVLL